MYIFNQIFQKTRNYSIETTLLQEFSVLCLKFFFGPLGSKKLKFVYYFHVLKKLYKGDERGLYLRDIPRQKLLLVNKEVSAIRGQDYFLQLIPTEADDQLLGKRVDIKQCIDPPHNLVLNVLKHKETAEKTYDFCNVQVNSFYCKIRSKKLKCPTNLFFFKGATDQLIFKISKKWYSITL